MYADMSINSHYRGREMATTSGRVHPAGIAGRGDDEEDDSSCYSSEEDLMDAQDTSRLLREPGDPRSSRSHYETPLPNSSTGIYPQLQPLAPEPIIPAAGAVMAATTAPVTHNTQYGSVSDGSSLPSTGRNNPKKKRYRLPFLILLVFDFGLVVFLSIISYDSQVCKIRERRCEKEAVILINALYFQQRRHIGKGPIAYCLVPWQP